MIITIPEIEAQFNKWNEIIFNNSLPKPAFELMQTKSLLGQFKWRRIGFDKIGYTIRISVYYDRPIDGYIDTIVHEMLHYYIKYNNIKDSSSHGKTWKKMAKEISQKHNLNIARTNPAGGGATEAVIEKKRKKEISKFECVAVCKSKDKKFYAAVIPFSKINKYAPKYRAWNLVKDLKFVRAPWSQTYKLRHVRTAVGLRGISFDTYNDLLKNEILDF